MTKIKYIDIKEFVDYGYLQELNRLFLHPLGFALQVRIDDIDGGLIGIIDSREDPEGMMFAEAQPPDADKAERVLAAWEAHEMKRLTGLGWMIQPDSRGHAPPCSAYHCGHTL